MVKPVREAARLDWGGAHMQKSKPTPCGYDGTKRKLPDGRCATCGRTAEEGAHEAITDAAIEMLGALGAMTKISWSAPAGTGERFEAAKKKLGHWIAFIGIR